ncbi:MAG: hypothetical protein PWQ82_653 [Thermosediminibacterales bacterium]|nr:hypothetical protein [Thermosediminibacterales bacterium]
MSAVNIKIKKRLVLILLFGWIAYILLIGRLAWIQLVRGEELQKRALSQWTQEIAVEPKRGTIFDRHGRELAISASVDTIVAYPPEIKNPKETSEKLAEILSMDAEEIFQKITQKKGSVYIKRKVEDEISDAVRELELPGIGFTEESKRYYPDRNLASHILGFTGIDSQGLDGIEFYYDKYLKGFPGYIASETDALSRELPFGSQHYVPPKNGYNLTLTIDKVIQHIVEKELERAMNIHKTKKASAIVMNPQTGEILALVNKPDFDPNNWKEYSPKIWRNFAVSDVYEPGSTFKIVTASAGLEEGVVRPEDRFYDPGYIIVAGERIKCWKAGGHGSQTFVQVVENSCNPGFVSVGMKLGTQRFMEYIKAFGFGQTLGVDLPGEAKGIFNPEKVGPVELATISFGQGISVTPLQLISALSAVANGGKLMQPHLAKEFRDDDGNVILEFKPRVLRQVISEETSNEMRKILESVVANGTGKWAQIEGYRIAGKTGTAEKYRDGKYVASFVGFAPADDPQIAILVVLDEPVGVYYGGQTAGVVFKRIMYDVLRYLGIKPQTTENGELGKGLVPDVRNLYVSEATSRLLKSNLKFKIEGSGQIVIHQFPMPGAEVSEGTTVILTLNSSKNGENTVLIPDLTGKSIREASEILDAIGLRIEIIGSGLAVRQEPSAGQKVKRNTSIKVFFEPPSD